MTWRDAAKWYGLAPDRTGRLRPVNEQAEMTIEQLAQATGLTVRNIRSHRTAGLLPPPEVRNSIGYYGAEHLARLRLIQELQAEGFNLQAIKRLIDATHAPQSILGFRNVLFAPLEAQSSRIMEVQELLEMFGESATAEVIEAAIDVGELIPLEDGRIEVAHPTLLEAARELAAQGMELAPAIAVFETVRQQCDTVAKAFVQLFVDGIWRPFQEAGYPAERWPEITESIGRLRPIASQALIAVFQTELSDEIEERFGQEIAQLAGAAD
jgi:DNA-binding transcriptional MerR regulator